MDPESDQRVIPDQNKISPSLDNITDTVYNLAEILNAIIDGHSRVFAIHFEKFDHNYLSDRREEIYQSYIKSLTPQKEKEFQQLERPPIQVQIRVIEIQLREILAAGRAFVDTFHNNI